jgi:hypothetical protein
MRRRYHRLAHSADSSRETLAAVGRQLGSIYDVDTSGPLPDHLARLLDQLDSEARIIGARPGQPQQESESQFPADR